MDRDGIVVAGLSCLDLLLLGTEPLEHPEGASLVDSVQYVPGGSTSNTGRAIAELGVRVDVLTLLGDDDDGRRLLRFWSERGMGVSQVRTTAEQPTALSTVCAYRSGKRGFYMCLGTNGIMTPEHLLGPGLERLPSLACRVFHFGYPHLLPRMQGEPLAAFLAAVRAGGTAVSVDLNGASAERGGAGALPESAYPHVALVHANIDEAVVALEASRLPAGLAGAVAAARAAGRPLEEALPRELVAAVAEAFVRLGAGLAVVTLGPAGALAAAAPAPSLLAHFASLGLPAAAAAAAASRVVFSPGFAAAPGTPINATGAGDVFMAGLLCALHESPGAPLEELLALANAAAFERVTRAPADPVPPLPELRARLPSYTPRPQ